MFSSILCYVYRGYLDCFSNRVPSQSLPTFGCTKLHYFSFMSFAISLFQRVLRNHYQRQSVVAQKSTSAHPCFSIFLKRIQNLCKKGNGSVKLFCIAQIGLQMSFLSASLWPSFTTFFSVNGHRPQQDQRPMVTFQIGAGQICAYQTCITGFSWELI